MAELALQSRGAAADTSFVWRRLHSLSGLLPVGLFLAFHMFENAKALAGPEAYDEAVAGINALLPRPYFYALELLGLLLPIAFHALYGLKIVLEGEGNTGRYPYRSNRLYSLQRLSGVAAFFFILYHVMALRVGVTLLSHRVSYGDVVNHLAPAPVVLLYLVGVLSAEYHLANGLNGLAWSWGLAVSEKSRRTVEYLGWAVFAALAIPSVHLILFLHQ